ncbi:MAG: shikimate kinase [Treponema sp.]|nr:shikimate kinase [Treponema sp.]
MKSIILMGIKHCGKSTQAKLLGKEFKMPVYDTDNLIEDETGFSPREIFTNDGEAAFKEAEAQACAHLKEELLKSGKSAVIATGGGICNNAGAVEILKSLGICVFLKTDEKIAADRIVNEASVLPDGSIKNLPAYIAKKNPRSISEVREIFHAFHEERTKIYSTVADITVDMANAPRWFNTKQIVEALENR